MYRNDAPTAYWRDQLIEWGPRVIFAILILVVTHFVAKAVQWGVAKAIDRVPVLKRHPQAGGDSVGAELGRLAYWLVWLVGLIAALQPLGLSGVLTPVTSLTNEVFAFLPRLLGAGLFFFAGLILARIVRHVIEAALGALNIERLLGRAGISIGEPPLAVDQSGVAAEGTAPARSSIAKAVGVTVSAVIIIFAAIAALQILQISAISDPATAMLQTHRLGDPARACGSGLAGDRLPHRPLGQDDRRDGASEPRLRRQRSRAWHHAGQLQPVARGRRHRDDRDPARRGDRGRAASWAATASRLCCSRSPSLAAR